jgi:hypothetical protein
VKAQDVNGGPWSEWITVEDESGRDFRALLMASMTRAPGSAGRSTARPRNSQDLWMRI